MLKTLLPQHGDGNIYTPVCTKTMADESYRYSFLQDVTFPARGVRIEWRKSVNIWALHKTEEHGLLPAYYFPYEPDTEIGLVDMSTGNSNYHAMGDTADYATWTVPAAAVGHDKLVIMHFAHSATGGVADILINDVSVGEVDTTGADVDRETTTLTLSTPLALNDVIKVKRKVGDTDTIRLEAIYSYDSDGIVEAGNSQHRILDPSGSPTALCVAGQSWEHAIGIAPDGSAGKWTGGYNHQGGSDCTQVSVTETFYVDGSSVGLTAGYHIGHIRLTRASTIRYDATPTDIASAEEHYIITGDRLAYSYEIAATVTVDVAVSYMAMMICAAAAPDYIVLQDRVKYDLSGGLTVNFYNYLPIVDLVRVGKGGIDQIMLAVAPSTPVSQLFILNDNTKYKLYWEVRNLPDQASGTRLQGGWSYWIEREGSWPSTPVHRVL